MNDKETIMYIQPLGKTYKGTQDFSISIINLRKKDSCYTIINSKYDIISAIKFLSQTYEVNSILITIIGYGLGIYEKLSNESISIPIIPLRYKRINFIEDLKK